jgi:hypothetical protein
MHTVEFYSTLSRKEILTQATRMNFADIMLLQNTNTLFFPVFRIPKVVKFIGIRSKMVVMGGWKGICLANIVF